MDNQPQEQQKHHFAKRAFASVATCTCVAVFIGGAAILNAKSTDTVQFAKNVTTIAAGALLLEVIGASFYNNENKKRQNTFEERVKAEQANKHPFHQI